MIAPTTHYENIFEIPDSVSSSLLNAAKILGEHYRERIGSEGLNLMHASGLAAQQSVFHFHFHLIPRHAHDNLNTMPDMPKWQGDYTLLHEMLKITDSVSS